MAWYKTGLVNVTNGDTAVTAVGTRFISNVRVGDGFRGPDGEWYEIVNMASETAIGIYPAYAGPTVTESSDYMIAPLQGYNKETADRLRKITDGIGSVEGDVAAAKEAAEASAASAALSKTSETNAKSSETSAAQSSAQADSAKTAAEAAKTAAQTSQTAAEAAKNAAQASQTAAANSATNANTSASAALASQNAAKTSETNSKTSETNSKTSETNANASENAAKASQTAAGTSASQAAASATAAQTARTGAETAKTAAESAKTSAETANTSAKASESKAKDWASKPEDSIVESGLYSALHYAAKAKNSADSAATLVGPRLTSIAQAVLAVNDMLIADSSSTMKSFTTGTTGRLLLASENVQATRNTLELGTAATGNVTTSTTDTTSNRIMKVGDFGLGSENPPLLSDFNADVPAGFYRAYSADNANATPGGPPVSGSFAMSVLAMRGLNTKDYLMFIAVMQPAQGRAGNVWIGTRSSTGVTEWQTINPRAFGVGDHMKFTSNFGPGRALSTIEGNGFFASSVQVPTDWKSDGGGGTYPMGFTVQATAALGLQVAAGNGSNALHYRVRGPSSFLDWRKIYDNNNAIGVTSMSADGNPTGAIFEKGTNTNGTYTKFADGTMICRTTTTTPNTTWTALGSGFVSATVDVTLPATFASGADMVVFGNDIFTTAVSVNGYILTTNTVRIQGYYPIQPGVAARTFRLVIMGRWY